MPLYGGNRFDHQKDTDEAERVLQHLVSLEPKEARGILPSVGSIMTEEYQKAENVYHLLREMIPEKSPKRGLIEENLRKLEIMPKVRP